MSHLRAYLAGPDVFFPNPVEIACRKKGICARYGLHGVFPLDADFDLAGLSPPEQGQRCFDAMVKLMHSCDLVIANLTPFRGPSMDVGTAVELGFMHGLGKPVFGYTNVTTHFSQRVGADGFFVEAFDLVDNLMVEGTVVRSGAEVVRVSVPETEVYTSLIGFEKCVVNAVEVLAAKGKPEKSVSRF